jgi:hypothetical protein
MLKLLALTSLGCSPREASRPKDVSYLMLPISATRTSAELIAVALHAIALARESRLKADHRPAD